MLWALFSRSHSLVILRSVNIREHTSQTHRYSQVEQVLSNVLYKFANNFEAEPQYRANGWIHCGTCHTIANSSECTHNKVSFGWFVGRHIWNHGQGHAFGRPEDVAMNNDSKPRSSYYSHLRSRQGTTQWWGQGETMHPNITMIPWISQGLQTSVVTSSWDGASNNTEQENLNLFSDKCKHKAEIILQGIKFHTNTGCNERG